MTLIERLRKCAKLAGSGDELSRRTGIPRRTLENYLSGRSEPKAVNLEQICRVVGVNGHWLLTGDGPELVKDLESNATESSSPVDVELLGLVIARLEKEIATRGARPAPAKKAELIALLYDYMVETGKKEGPSVERILRLVA
jgi:transcriptional regulator with XRE-family HTH domain